MHRVERVPSGLGMAETEAGPRERMQPGVTTIGGGELLLPGEIALAEGESYTTPWVYLAASRDGLDGCPPSSTATCGPSLRTRAPPARST